MKTKNLLSVLTLFITISTTGQNTIELTFTAENNEQHVSLDSILVENLTQGGDTTLYSPDTVLLLEYPTSINEFVSSQKTLKVSQNYPNPFRKKTTVNLYLHDKEKVEIFVFDIHGNEIAKYKNTLIAGNHLFDFYPGNTNIYLFTVIGSHTKETIEMIKIDDNQISARQCKLLYSRNEESLVELKAQKATNDFPFNLGDQLRYTGYAKTINEVNGSDIIEDNPESNLTYLFQITEGIPCPGVPTLIYEGQEYKTVLIGEQCWMKENLNVGTRINGSFNMSNNGAVEKYCYDDNLNNCELYGGLYQWNEMMQYMTDEGAKGICPDGWHIPTDDEWKVLEGVVDSQFGVDDAVWNGDGYRGFDAGKNLKSTSGWDLNGNGVDLFGFDGLSSGYRSYEDGSFLYMESWALYWTSTVQSGSRSWDRHLEYNHDDIRRFNGHKEQGFSIRCIKD